VIETTKENTRGCLLVVHSTRKTCVI
jgi:hypothetical protein